MKRNVLTLLIGAVLIFICALLLFTFQVRQTEVAVVTTFGKPTRPITKPKLYFKWPWPIQQVHKFDQRIQTFDEVDKYSQELTADGNTLVTMVYVGWRITDPEVFFPKFAGGSVVEARKMLENLVRNAKGVVVGRHALSDFINADEKKLKFDAIEDQIKAMVQSQLQTNNCGIQVEFLGIKKLGLPESVTQTVFERMQSERKVLADKLEFEGQAEAAKIRSDADRQSAEIISRAESEAQIIIGRGEAVAAETLPVFQQNPELANFLLGLRSLEASTREKTTLIFDSRTPPFNYLTLPSTNSPAR